MGKVTRTRTPVRQAIERAIQDAPGLTAKVGFFESAKYPDGTSIAYVAAIQEHGAASQGIPPRPFMRITMMEQGATWKELMARGAKRFMSGKSFMRDEFEKVSAVAAGDVRKTISELSDPPLKKSTLLARQYRAAKGKKYKSLSIKPLVDTGAMLAHVTNMVEAK